MVVKNSYITYCIFLPMLSTFSNKFSDLMIFPAIEFQSNMDLLNFYAGSKSNYMVFLETKNDII